MDPDSREGTGTRAEQARVGLLLLWPSMSCGLWPPETPGGQGCVRWVQAGTSQNPASWQNPQAQVPECTHSTVTGDTPRNARSDGSPVSSSQLNSSPSPSNAMDQSGFVFLPPASSPSDTVTNCVARGPGEFDQGQLFRDEKGLLGPVHHRPKRDTRSIFGMQKS